MKKKNKVKIALIILAVIALLTGLYFAGTYYRDSVYDTGVQDGITIAVIAVLQNINDEGFVDISFSVDENQTVNVRLVPLEK